MGGKPSKATPPDRRLKRNRDAKPTPQKMPAKMPTKMPMRPQRRGGK